MTAALELLRMLSDTPERAQKELALQIALGAPLIATKGYGAPAVEQAYTRALELCRQVGETPQLFLVLWGLWVFHLIRGQYQKARGLGERCLALAQRVQDSALLLEAHIALGETLYYLGEFAPAREHLEQSLTLYDPQQHRSHAFLYGQDPGVIGQSIAAWVLWALGYPDQAIQRSQRALALAQELSHPNSLAFALTCGGWLYWFRRETQHLKERAETILKRRDGA